MWRDSEDPGGGSSHDPPPQSSQDLQDMKDEFAEQQLLITQLQEIMKKSDQSVTAVTQEKVAEYANTLTKMKSRAKRHGLTRDKDSGGDSELPKLKNTPASEKVLLLRQQLEQNKVKLAERGKNQKGIEEMVAQVKAQLDDSQQQINLSQTPINISLFDDRVDYTPQMSAHELYSILLNKDKRINEMNGKVSKLQANVLDLQENLKEKDSVIDARTKAITLMSENLSKKGKTTLDALEDTKEQMRQMQENFIHIEEQLKAENATLQINLDKKCIQVQRLEAENNELTLKQSELQKTESKLRSQIIELEKRKSSPTSSPSRRSPSKNRKNKKGKFSPKADNIKTEEEYNAAVKDLEKQLIDKSKEVDSLIQEIEVMKKSHSDALQSHQQTIKELEDKQAEKKYEMNTIKEAKVVSDSMAETGDTELNKLKQQLDDANKAMIKVKAQHKSKIKELMKKIEAFKQISNVNAEIVKMENENSKLQMKIIELEEERGKMQLARADSKESLSIHNMETRLTELSSKLEERERIINNHVADISKYQDEIQTLQGKLDQMASDEVKQELSTVQFEEQYESLEKEKNLLHITISTLESSICDFRIQLDALQKDKHEIQIKCDGLQQENAELIDRLEKLSTEKVSSAESIEIVENLTQQEKLELEAYQKSLLPKNSLENLEDNADLNDSVNQLTEETSELLQKIELFTIERREVMEKLELLTEENNQLNLKLKEIENNRDVLVETYEQLQTEKELLDTKLEEYEVLLGKKSDASDDIEEYKKLIQVQQDEINDLQLKLFSIEKDATRADNGKKWEEKYMSEKVKNEELLKQFAEISDANLNYEEIIQENKQSLIKYAELLESNSKLNEEFEQLGHELEKGKQTEVEYAVRLDEAKLEIKNLCDSVDEYEKELNEKCAAIKELEGQVLILREEKVCIENNLAEKLSEVESVRLEKEQKEIENEKLMKQSVSANSQADLEAKMRELQAKNKEQLEKMKKIAANLKKKTLDCKELESKYNELCALKESAQQAAGDYSASGKLLKEEVAMKTEQLSNLSQEHRTLQLEMTQTQTRNEEITSQLHTYSAQIEDLQNIIREYESQLSSLNREIDSIRSSASTNETTDVIRRLNEEIDALQYNSHTSNNALQMKIHELEVSIETYELELQKYKEKASRLEEGLAQVEACRQSLEEKSIDLSNRLECRESSFIAATEKEQELEMRLTSLAEKDRRSEQKLDEVQKENDGLQSDNQKLTAAVESYKNQIHNYNLRIQEYEANQEMFSAMEAEKQRLEMKCKHLDSEVKKVHLELETFQSETQKGENEMQQQLEQYIADRKQMMEQLEIQREEGNALTEARNNCQRDIDDLNNKLDQQQTEFDVTINKYHGLQQEHNKTLSQLENQAKIIETQENKIQDFQHKQVQTPEYYKQELNKKMRELDEFKRNYVPSPADFFNENPTEANLNKDIDELKYKLEQFPDNETKLQELEHVFHQQIAALQSSETMLKQFQAELFEKDQQIQAFEVTVADLKRHLDFARNMLEHVEASNGQTLISNNYSEQEVRFDDRNTDDSSFAYVQDKDQVTESVPNISITQSQSSHGNTAEELQQKIKTLEFMVYNAEQEKESAQIQCAQLSEELGRFIYEREKYQNTICTIAPTSSESQASLPESHSNLESQIVSGDEIAIPPQIPYNDSKDLTLCFSSENITEDLCSQKRAYECTPSAFADDDGWGFDVEESKLDEARFQISAQANDDGIISELTEKVRLFTLEREAHLEEIHQGNVKCGKLIKKLKEFKARNEQLVNKMKAKGNDDFGLENAIQDELKTQIASLEKRLKETDAELIKERAERDSIAKRVDVLASANERMIEMKEKQDIEVMAYQQQARDLQLKLEHAATWSSDFSEHVVSTSSNTTTTSATSLATDNPEIKLEELRESIRELTMDNEELQALLEEQIRLRKEAESRAKCVPVGESEQLRLALEEKANLISQIRIHENDKESLHAELDNAKTNFSEICEQRDCIMADLKTINGKLQENYKEKTLLEASLLENGILIESLKKTIDELHTTIEVTNTDSGKQFLEEELSSLRTTLSSLQSEKEQFLHNNLLLESTLNDLRKELQQNQIELACLQSSREESALLSQQVANLKDELKDFASIKQKLSDQQSEFDQKLLASTEELALEWAQHVDQRGTDVAESWKLHVETRENEFVQLEQSLRKELNEVEEKCNALVNENNELRRNVDAEIRNEVDRVSALQQQISDRQAHVTKLTETVQQKDVELKQVHEENSNLIKQLREYEGRINTGNEELNTLLQRQDDKDQTIADLSAKLQFASDNKMTEEFIQALQTQLVAKDNEITECKCTIDELTSNMEEMEKLKTRVEETQMQLLELRNEKERNDKLKQKLEKSSFQVTTLQGTLQEKELRLQELESLLQQKQTEGVNSQIQLQTHVQELQQQIAQYIMQLQENNLHIASLNEEIESYKVLSNHLQTKDAEIQKLTQLLATKTREHEYAMENQLLDSQSVLAEKTQEQDALRRILNQTEIDRDEILLAKATELEAYKEQLDLVNKELKEYQAEYTSTQNNLTEVSKRIEDYEKQIATHAHQLIEYEQQISELNGIIEGQVLKIDELQQDIYEKSRNYDAVVAEIENTDELQKKVRFQEGSQGQQETNTSKEEEALVVASRAELDLALYMLHQRDVRCEELTVELMQLLEERDTLQLRLSNALRENEAVRAGSGGVRAAAASSGSASSSDTTIISGSAISSVEMTEAPISGLANKLTELKIVGYKKDKTLVDEQELRRLQQMAFLQQHKDDVSKLPAEAQARLRDANYTLSRDVQSPSKVLLNWLWGTSTPKVNNT